MSSSKDFVTLTAVIFTFTILLTIFREPQVHYAYVSGDSMGEEDLKQLREKRILIPIKDYLHSELVIWDSYHDMPGIQLKDGRYLRPVNNINSDLHGDLLKFKKGRELYLCYSENQGLVLFDFETSLSYQVRGITDKHPIDDYVLSLLAVTTWDMFIVCREEERLWRKEIDRMVREVLSFKNLPAKARRSFLKLSEARINYCNAHSVFIDYAISERFNGGSFGGPAIASSRAQIFRDAYFSISRHYDDCIALDREPFKQQ